MKIGVVTPDRNDRPKFLERCKYYVKRQTVKVDFHEIVNYPQKTFPIDITERYMIGLNNLKDKCDVILFMENDDYYAPHYVERMIQRWKEFGSPELFGIGETYFYHIGSQHYWHREHTERACAYSTMIRADAVHKINHSTYDRLLFDMGVWRQFQGPTCLVTPPITIGIKHGFGVCGAAGHNAWFYDKDPRSHKDSHYKWLTAQIGEEDAEWYREMAKERKP